MPKEPQLQSKEPQLQSQDNAQRIRSKIKQTWSNLTEDEVLFYEKGDRDAFFNALNTKYKLSREQAEKMLSDIERVPLKAA